MTAKRPEARQRHLDAVAARGPGVWDEIEALVESKKPALYTQALAAIADLRDLAAREGMMDAFDRTIAGLRARHTRKTTFLQRLDRALGTEDSG